MATPLTRLDTSSPYRIPTPRDDNDDSQSSSNPSPTREIYEESDFFEGYNDSQSSIGLPTHQDTVNELPEEACVPLISRLPAEVLINIFVKLSSPADLFSVMLTSKQWCSLSVALLWQRPNCADTRKHELICNTISLEHPYFDYTSYVRRLNLQSLAKDVNDGTVIPFASCNRIERLTLTQCTRLTDGGLMALLENNSNLLALDISGNKEITHKSIEMLAEHCRKLQGLNVSQCHLISNEAMIKLAEGCKQIKRLKLNHCFQLDNRSILKFATNCRFLLEIDLHKCHLISDAPITKLMEHGRSLRELRLAECDEISDYAFLNLPPGKTFDALRILDLSSCHRLTDRAIAKIIDCAPRLRNLVLAKCRLITNTSLVSISKLGKNLHFLHLGHCQNITDDAVIKLVTICNRIRYIDLGCCVHLTDATVRRLAMLPKLRRIGLVKCHLITNDSVLALSNSAKRYIHPGSLDSPGPYVSSHSSLERVHLSYCTNLTLDSIIRLLNSCPRLTHLSLTGVTAFLRDDLSMFCREAPSDFTVHQREVFCVFSGQGVVNLRSYLNQQRPESIVTGPHMRRARGQHPVGNAAPLNAHMHPSMHATQANVQEDDVEADADRDDDMTVNGDEGPDDQSTAIVGAMGHASISHTPPALFTPGVFPVTEEELRARFIERAASLALRRAERQQSAPGNSQQHADDAGDSEEGGSTIVP